MLVCRVPAVLCWQFCCAWCDRVQSLFERPLWTERRFGDGKQRLLRCVFAAGQPCVDADPGYFVNGTGAKQQSPCPLGRFSFRSGIVIAGSRVFMDSLHVTGTTQCSNCSQGYRSRQVADLNRWTQARSLRDSDRRDAHPASLALSRRSRVSKHAH